MLQKTSFISLKIKSSNQYWSQAGYKLFLTRNALLIQNIVFHNELNIDTFPAWNYYTESIKNKNNEMELLWT